MNIHSEMNRIMGLFPQVEPVRHTDPEWLTDAQNETIDALISQYFSEVKRGDFSHVPQIMIDEQLSDEEFFNLVHAVYRDKVALRSTADSELKLTHFMDSKIELVCTRIVLKMADNRRIDYV